MQKGRLLEGVWYVYMATWCACVCQMDVLYEVPWECTHNMNIVT